MGHAGNVEQRARARQLRAEAQTLREIAEELGVSKASVSVWVRDVEFTPRPRSRGHSSQRPHPLHLERLADIERARVEAEATIGDLSDRDLLLFGLGLYARLRVRLYLHDGLDLEDATQFWSELLDVPIDQFHRPYRAASDHTRRTSTHVRGCPTLSYDCVSTHRRVMAMIAAIASPFVDPG